MLGETGKSADLKHTTDDHAKMKPCLFPWKWG